MCTWGWKAWVISIFIFNSSTQRLSNIVGPIAFPSEQTWNTFSCLHKPLVLLSFSLFYFYIIFKGCFPWTVIAKYWLLSLCCIIHPWACCISNSLHLPLHRHHPSPLVTTCLFSPSVSASLWIYSLELPSWVSGKQPACQSRRHKRGVFDPWVGKIPWRAGHGNPLWYSCPENPMDRGTWQATGHGVAESDVTDIQSLVCCVF